MFYLSVRTELPRAEDHMLRRSLFGLVLAVTTLAGGTPAQAASKHRFSVTATESVISQSAGYPNPGSTIIRARIVTGTFGDGAIVERARITGHPNPAAVTFKSTVTAFYALGTFRSALSGTATLQANGSISLTGHAHYTGGSGSYRGAHGQYSFRAVIPPATPNRPGPAVGHVSGTVVY
jgi:hypothetical protein